VKEDVVLKSVYIGCLFSSPHNDFVLHYRAESQKSIEKCPSLQKKFSAPQSFQWSGLFLVILPNALHLSSGYVCRLTLVGCFCVCHSRLVIELLQ